MPSIGESRIWGAGFENPEPPHFGNTFLERIAAWIYETFPVRQLYVRSDGRVSFFAFSPGLQAVLAGIGLLFLGWVAFASVNVIFKDRILAARDHRYAEMQGVYENRVANLQLAYDEINPILKTSLTIQTDALNCLESLCRPESREQIEQGLRIEAQNLRVLGISPAVIAVPKSNRATPMNLSASESVSWSQAIPKGYAWAKSNMDAIFDYLTRKHGAKLSDETFLQIACAVAGALLSGMAKFLWRSVWRLTRGTPPPGAPI